MTPIDHQQAAVDRVRMWLLGLGTLTLDEVNDLAPKFVTAAAPHLRAACAAELGATFQSGERWNETYRKGLRTLQYEKAYLDGVIDILALLEGGGE